MFSDNHQISLRQTFRLFTFDFMGIGTLIVPAYLSGQLGIYGALAIVLGGALGLVYLRYLGWNLNRMQTDFGTYLSEKGKFSDRCSRLIFAYLSVYCILAAADTAAIFADLIHKSLIREENYVLILALLLAVGVYAVSGGIESRARIYEILFWLILIPLFLMLAFSLDGIDAVNMSPQMDFSVKKLFSCAYLMFLNFETMFFMLFFPRYLPEKTDTKRLVACISWSLVCAAGILLVLFLILTGTFGQAALAKMEYPAVTLMSSVQIPGNFVKRLDALMMGVWFFTLYALLNLNLHYGYQMMEHAVKRPGKGRYLAITAVLIFAIALVLHYAEGMHLLLYRFFWFIGVPIYILLPAAVVWKGNRNEKKNNKN